MAKIQILILEEEVRCMQKWRLIALPEELTLISFVGTYEDAVAELEYAQDTIIDGEYVDEVILVGQDGTIER